MANLNQWGGQIFPLPQFRTELLASVSDAGTHTSNKFIIAEENRREELLKAGVEISESPDDVDYDPTMVIDDKGNLVRVMPNGKHVSFDEGRIGEHLTQTFADAIRDQWLKGNGSFPVFVRGLK